MASKNKHRPTSKQQSKMGTAPQQSRVTQQSFTQASSDIQTTSPQLVFGSTSGAVVVPPVFEKAARIGKSAVLDGRPTKLPVILKDESIGRKENRRGKQRENEAADTIVKNGYNITHNPEIQGKKNPDYIIDGKIYDCYSPSLHREIPLIVKKIITKVNSGQAARIVLNLDDWKGKRTYHRDVRRLKDSIREASIDGLKGVMIVRRGTVTQL